MNNAVPTTEAQPLWQEVEMPKWETNRTAWLLTCVDLTSLLVGFFVLLFSTQTLQRDKWEAVTGSFKQQFAPRETVVAMVPDGGDNAVVRVTGVKSGLAYLDTLLHQRLEGDVVWDKLQADRSSGMAGQDLRYALPTEVVDGSAAGTHDAWMRLAGAIRGWKNAVGVRVSAGPGEIGKAARQGAVLGDKLIEGGVADAFTEIVVDQSMTGTRFELVVRAR